MMIDKIKQGNSKRIDSMLNSKEEQMDMDKAPSFADKLSALLSKIGYRKKSSLLGLEIGKWAVKWVEFEQTKQGWKLLDVDMEKITNSPKDALEKMLKRRKSRADMVVSAVPSEWVIEQMVKLPYVKEKELRQMLGWEVKKHIDFSLEEAVWDYFQMNEPEEGEQVEVFLTVSRKESIKKHLELIESCELKGLALETKSLALYNALRLFETSFYQKTLMLVDLGFDSSHLIMVKNGMLSMSRKIGFGGGQITETLSNLLNCNIDEAEKLKEDVDIYEENEKSEGVNINRIIQNQLDNLVTEIQRSWDFFLLENPQVEAGKIILAGGTANLGSLDRYLKEKLNIEVEIFDPSEIIQLEQLKIKKEKLKTIWPHLAVVLGLATWREK